MSTLVYDKLPRDIPLWMKVVGWGFLAFASIAVCRSIYPYTPIVVPMSFDSEVWKSQIPLRRNMLGDLLESGKVIGHTPHEVEELLGPQDGHPWNNSAAGKDCFYALQHGDLFTSYVDLVQFEIQNGRVVGSKRAEEKYF